MEQRIIAKQELTDLISSYNEVERIVAQLREEGVISPHDCDNVLGHLKSGMIEDVLLYARSYLTQDNQKNAIKTMEDYFSVKKALEGKGLKPDDVKEIMGLYFKK